jgi:hypothetical protein
MRINEYNADWVVISLEPGVRQLAFQRAAAWVKLRWPDPAYPRQLHLDIRVSHADHAEEELPTVGASVSQASGRRASGPRRQAGL